MTRITHSAALLAAAASFIFLLPAANGSGCGGDDVPIGNDGGGNVGAGNTGTDSGTGTGTGGSGTGGSDECFAGGPCGTNCTRNPIDIAILCDWSPAFDCYDTSGTCEENSNGECGWRDTPELQACLDAANEPRVPVTEACIKNADDSCATDADCVSGGCGGELCYNPANNDGISTCECSKPGPAQVTGCGCVAHKCTWYK